jgi:hypothetical protein
MDTASAQAAEGHSCRNDLLPLLLGSLLHTLAPGVLGSAPNDGAVFQRRRCDVIALQLFCIGAQIR